MGVSYFPGAPQYGGSTPGPDAGLVQLALAVKQQKIAEADRKRAEAQQKAQMLINNPALLVMTDPKDVEKALKEGFNLNFDDKKPINPNAPMPTAPAPQGGGGVSGDSIKGLDPNAMAAVGNAMQGNKAGAQAASPPTPGASNKAPGGGVQPTGDAQIAEHLASQASHGFSEKFGAMAPLYGSAMSQLQLEQVKAQGLAEIETLKSRAAGGDLQAMGRLMIMSGKQVTDSDMRAMIMSSNMDPKVVSQAMDFALGNETEADKAKRFTDTIKTLSSTPQLMDRLQNPGDVTTYARAIVYGGTLPDIPMKPHSLAELTQEAEYEKFLVTEVGLTGDLSHTVARARTDGIDISNALPPAMRGLFSKAMNQPTLSQRGVGAKEKQAQASLLSAEAEMNKVKVDGLKITSELSVRGKEALNDRLKMMVEAQKAKHPWPDEVQQALINEVAREANLQPEQVKRWYQYLTGGTSWQYSQVPDSDLAKTAAGGGGGTAPAKRGPTFAEQGGVKGALSRAGALDASGNVKDPFTLEHQLLTSARDRSLQYLKDILYGTSGAPDAKR